MNVRGAEKLVAHLTHCVEKIWPSQANPEHAAENVQLARNMSHIVRYFNGHDAIKKYRTLDIVKYRYTLASQHKRNELHKQYNVMLISQGYNGSVGIIFDKLYGIDAEASFEGFARKVDDILDDIMKGVLDRRMTMPLRKVPCSR